MYIISKTKTVRKATGSGEVRVYMVHNAFVYERVKATHMFPWVADGMDMGFVVYAPGKVNEI